MQISLTRPPSRAWGIPRWEPLASHCELPGSADPVSHLVVANGHGGVEKVPNLPEALKAFSLQPQTLRVALQDGLIDEQPDFLYLGYLETLQRDLQMRWGREKTTGNGSLLGQHRESWTQHGEFQTLHRFWSEPLGWTHSTTA